MQKRGSKCRSVTLSTAHNALDGLDLSCAFGCSGSACGVIALLVQRWRTNDYDYDLLVDLIVVYSNIEENSRGLRMMSTWPTRYDRRVRDREAYTFMSSLADK